MTMAVPAMRAALAQAYTSHAVQMSLHTADPGTTGASEVTGGTPAYARVALTWGSPTDGGTYTYVQATASADFNVPANTDIAYYGLWDASGNFMDSGAYAQSFVSAGTLHIDQFTYYQY